jgi:hypothetical protein
MRRIHRQTALSSGNVDNTELKILQLCGCRLQSIDLLKEFLPPWQQDLPTIRWGGGGRIGSWWAVMWPTAGCGGSNLNLLRPTLGVVVQGYAAAVVGGGSSSSVGMGVLRPS